ncbi:hypothetical protein AALA61_09275 [Oscillospiraceae bacterium 42-9]|jgi:hypothetical protein|uniref:hypothetical protein n=1 Tax=Acutalibacter sp. TaxID=1918636 RepID=UPI0021734522|nr:hypothetical protein [Acutalibacter sp.]
MMNNQRECGRNSAGMRRVHGRADYIAEADGAAQMDNFEHLPQENFDTEEMRGSMQAILSQNIGNFVVIEFLIGTGEIVRKQGMLYLVGRSFVTLYDEPVNNFIVCDIFSVKFVYFFMPNERPRFNYNILPHPNQNGRRSM